jgi:EpsI family protein
MNARSQFVHVVVIALLMVCASVAAAMLKPTRLLADTIAKIDLEHNVPEQFGPWVLDRASVGAVVNPQQAEMLDKIYSELLSRTYINTSNGRRIMLSIAYGRDQSDDGNALHYPEICYPAQGFQVLSNKTGVLPLGDQGSIKVRRLETLLGDRRYEPLTYWSTVGSEVVLGGTDKKLAEMRYSLKGYIPDGLIFRVSSIDRDTEQAYRLQNDFVSALLAAMKPASRERLAGQQFAAVSSREP